ncbi:MAG TPA: PfkB family carbohydrate kinase [Spirochaetota bacterium]|nr:PfkB family carbohydrate kinase [Spirochaetota bacterium]HNT11654.1 PfkB family carbohydrate kinase [Spirochaetota bacterium]
MKIGNKITANLDELASCVNDIRRNGKKVSLCQGHFNVIHPGHLRFLEFAKKQGDFFIVVIQGKSRIDESVREKFYRVDDRARGVASLEYVDRVFVFDEIDFDQIIRVVRPDVYVMGEEFAGKIDLIKNDVELVESFGGRIIFSSGDIRYSTTEYLDKNARDILEERKSLYHHALKKQNIEVRRLIEYCDMLSAKHLLVIGDSIVDQYVACDALGMSSEAPVLVVRELESKEYVGGAAIVSRHVRALSSRCTFISLVGDDQPGETVRDELKKESIEARLIIDGDRPTTFKIRYMVDTQKILRVSRLEDHHLNQKMEETVIQQLDELAGSIDGIIVSDFGYGMITPRILDHLTHLQESHAVKLFGDVQSSSQIGNVAKFINYYCLTPTEKEARIALEDKYSGLEAIGANLVKKTGAKNIILKLGSEGFIAFEGTQDEFFFKTQHFPALNPNPVDVVGAGDSLLTGLAVSCCVGASLMEASAIASVVASIAIGKMGNIPITVGEVKNYLATM